MAVHLMSVDFQTHTTPFPLDTLVRWASERTNQPLRVLEWISALLKTIAISDRREERLQ